MNEYVVFDIETAPLDDSVLLSQWGSPGEIPYPGEFDPDSVKLGNTTDPAKIEKKIEAARLKHADSMRLYEQDVSASIEDHVEELRGKATLHAESGRIITIGRKYNGDYRIPEASEREQIEEFWRVFQFHRDNGNILIGFNIKEFDLPWIMRRSYAVGVHPPTAVLDKDRWWHSCLVDVMQKWVMGCYGGIHKPSLHRLSIALGGEGKDMSGSLLHSLWETDREAAKKYVQKDLDLTEFCARKMFII